MLKLLGEQAPWSNEFTNCLSSPSKLEMLQPFQEKQSWQLSGKTPTGTMSSIGHSSKWNHWSYVLWRSSFSYWQCPNFFHQEKLFLLRLLTKSKRPFYQLITNIRHNSCTVGMGEKSCSVTGLVQVPWKLPKKLKTTLFYNAATFSLYISDFCLAQLSFTMKNKW